MTKIKKVRYSDGFECYYRSDGTLIASGHGVWEGDIYKEVGVELIQEDASDELEEQAELGITPESIEPF